MSDGTASVRALLELINGSAENAMAEYERHGAPVPALQSTRPHPLDQIQDVLRLRKIVRTLEGACEQLCATLAPPAASVVNRGQNLDWIGLRVVVKAKVADVLEKHPEGLHIDKIGEAVQIDPGKISRVMRMLASKHVFTEVDKNVFSNNRLSVVLRSSVNTSSLVYCNTTLAQKGASVFFENITAPATRFSYETTSSAFMQAVKSEGVEGSFYNWLQANPDERKEFARAMGGLGHVMGSLSILTHFPWTNVSTLCDVGSGVGSFTLPLAKAFPSIKLTLLDRPETIEQAKSHWKSELPNAVSEGHVQFVPANFFESIPSADQDIYYLRNIVHNWPDADAAKILRNIRSVMGPRSRVLLHEYVLQNLNPAAKSIMGPETAPSPLLPNYGGGVMRSHYQDIRMLFVYNAKERTFDEFIELGLSSGLKFEKYWDMGDTSVMEFSKSD
ncbi:hypothetical protein D9757_009921 [Collybiopsis confluens]|uniref:O-methyltransferase domain-containing protein n=1 Tax=Collybiopsis confluens TaxID=2823264 RepID=A0A8H5GWI1_9AGAR|nr:hypothetical protein D9757_009921 [Collybiopsis confluens]